MAASTLFLSLLGRGQCGGGQGAARRKEKAKALLKHMYYNRRAIRLAALALLCFLGLVATWRMSGPSSAVEGPPASLARVVNGAGLHQEGAPRRVAAVGEEEEEGEGEEGGSDDDDEGGGSPGAAGLGEGGGGDDDKADEEGEDEGEGEGGGEKEEAAAAAAPPPPLKLDPDAERRRNHCMAEYGERRYNEDEATQRVPPILYSYPGESVDRSIDRPAQPVALPCLR